MPVEPTDLFPIEAIKSTLLQEKFDARPYSMGVGDFEVAMITPTLKYRAEKESEIRAAKEKGKRNRKSEVAVQDSFRPLDDLKNWEVYVIGSKFGAQSAYIDFHQSVPLWLTN